MSGYTLTWRGGQGVTPVDGACLRGDALQALARTEIERLPVCVGRATAALGDLFAVAPAGDARIVVQGAPPLDRIGARMASGELIVEGDAGDDLGASMRGGVIRVRGGVGHRCGGPDHACDRGMTGGAIIVQGRAGDHAGLRMRRGLLAAIGGAGASPGHRMLAGTIVVGAGDLDHPGLEMRRGTVLSLDPAMAMRISANFAAVGVFDAPAMPVLALIRSAMTQAGVALSARQQATRFRLWTGDRFELGKGELWQAVS